MWTLEFWKAALERAIKTFCGSLASMLVAKGTGLLDTDWVAALSIVGMSTLISVLMSVGSASFGNPGPSLSTEALREQV